MGIGPVRFITGAPRGPVCFVCSSGVCDVMGVVFVWCVVDAWCVCVCKRGAS